MSDTYVRNVTDTNHVSINVSSADITNKKTSKSIKNCIVAMLGCIGVTLGVGLIIGIVAAIVLYIIFGIIALVDNKNTPALNAIFASNSVQDEILNGLKRITKNSATYIFV